MPARRNRISSQIILLSISFGFVLLIVVGIVIGWLMQSIDGGYLERERELIGKGVQDQVSRQLAEQGIISVWDDAIMAIRKQDDAWLAQYLVEWPSGQYGFNRIYVLSPTGNPLRAARDGKRIDVQSFRNESPAVVSFVTEARVAFRARSTDADLEQLSRSELVSSTDDGAAIVTIRPIIPSSKTLVQPIETENYLVFVRSIDEKFASEVGTYFLIDDVAFSKTEERSGGRASLALFDSKDQAVGYLTWRPRQPIHEALANVGPFVAVALMGCGLIVIELLRRLKRASVALEQSEAQALHLAYYDHLSSLENRASFNIKLRKAIDGLRERNQPFALFYIDLDKFKQVNDVLGHAAGDEVIRETGARLVNVLRDADVAARLGGDEFAVIAAGIIDPAQAEALGTRIIGALEKPIRISSQDVTVGASVGGFVVSDRSCDADAALSKADAALYQAKSSGRGRFQLA